MCFFSLRQLSLDLPSQLHKPAYDWIDLDYTQGLSNNVFDYQNFITQIIWLTEISEPLVLKASGNIYRIHVIFNQWNAIFANMYKTIDNLEVQHRNHRWFVFACSMAASMGPQSCTREQMRWMSATLSCKCRALLHASKVRTGHHIWTFAFCQQACHAPHYNEQIIKATKNCLSVFDVWQNGDSRF